MKRSHSTPLLAALVCAAFGVTGWAEAQRPQTQPRDGDRRAQQPEGRRRGEGAQDPRRRGEGAQRRRRGQRPLEYRGRQPDHRNVKYGPHERNVFDLFQADTSEPAPLLIFIHGGGFRAGDKTALSRPLLESCMEAGISVATINYRLSHQAVFPAPMRDGARAVQFLRYKAREYNIDPKRVACSGGSAGAGISLWIGYHDDMADPTSEDPVKRQSTRLTAMAVFGAQCSYDPHYIKKHIGGRAHEHPAILPFYGLRSDEVDSPRAKKLFGEASPINYVSRDDPPVYMVYYEPKRALPTDGRPGMGIHHPRFGELLKEKLDPHRIECVLRHKDEYGSSLDGRMKMNRDLVRFLQKRFGIE